MAVVMARKHSANSSVRAGKGKFEPANTVRRNEIVEEIVVSLRPWKDRKTSAAITAEVNHELDVLLELAPKQAKLYDRSRNRAHAYARAPSIQDFGLTPTLTMPNIFAHVLLMV